MKSSKVLVPNKKRTAHAIKKVQLKNIDKKQNKNNKTEINKTENNNNI